MQLTPREIYLMHEAFYADRDAKEPPLEFKEWLDQLEDGRPLRELLAEEAPSDERLMLLREYMPETVWWNLVRDHPIAETWEFK